MSEIMIISRYQGTHQVPCYKRIKQIKLMPVVIEVRFNEVISTIDKI